VEFDSSAASTGGITVNGVVNPASVDGVVNPASVNGVAFATVDPYWPVAGVPKPQHLWPFSQTGDYTDQGSVGGLDLTAGGTGNTFNNGLVFTGAGYAYSAAHADVSNLGAVWSLIAKVNFGATLVDGAPILNSWASDYSTAYDLSGSLVNGNDIGMSLYTDMSNYMSVNKNPVVPHTDYLCIVTFDNGTLKLYINGVLAVDYGGDGTPPVTSLDTGMGLYVGSYFDVSQFLPNGTVISFCGVLKGTAWSSGDVAAINAGLSLGPPDMGAFEFQE
jgi:hypothetical protein